MNDTLVKQRSGLVALDEPSYGGGIADASLMKTLRVVTTVQYYLDK